MIALQSPRQLHFPKFFLMIMMVIQWQECITLTLGLDRKYQSLHKNYVIVEDKRVAGQRSTVQIQKRACRPYIYATPIAYRCTTLSFLPDSDTNLEAKKTCSKRWWFSLLTGAGLKATTRMSDQSSENSFTHDLQYSATRSSVFPERQEKLLSVNNTP